MPFSPSGIAVGSKRRSLKDSPLKILNTTERHPEGEYTTNFRITRSRFAYLEVLVFLEPEGNNPVLDSESNAEEIIRSIKFDNLTAEEFDRYWQDCTNYRLNKIQACSSTAEALEKWPYYKKPLGFRLIDMDFKVLHANACSLLDNWEAQRTKIALFLTKDQNLKDRRLVQLLKEWMSDKLDDSKIFSFLFYLRNTIGQVLHLEKN
ncbi:uncharacterized protein LOC129942297 [Eupeodes corollae]|uniref:uncharacterized protein LOC129942297 n=1 Tax=Eupeodes corollae TaxID=290404 RepID=UPI0024922EC4|nr:uncharacterized protein LOC129942297 [Eupeodes corollae]